MRAHLEVGILRIGSVSLHDPPKGGTIKKRKLRLLVPRPTSQATAQSLRQALAFIYADRLASAAWIGGLEI